MKISDKVTLFLVDDDPLFLKSLEWEFLKAADFSIVTLPTGERCLENLSRFPDVIIMNYHLNAIEKNAMNGMQALDKIKAINPDIPVIMLSSQNRIDIAIDCLHHRACDYVVKSESAFARLQKIITKLFSYKRMEKELNWYLNRV